MDRTKYAHVNIEGETALLWEDMVAKDANGLPILSRVDRFHEKIVPHEKSVLFGYADVTLVFRTKSGVLAPVKLRGLVVKSLKNQPHLDMPAEQGADKEWYDQYMPRSSALRTVVTTLVFNDEQVLATIDKAAGAPAQESTETPAEAPEGEFSEDNPFAQKQGA